MLWWILLILNWGIGSDGWGGEGGKPDRLERGGGVRLYLGKWMVRNTARRDRGQSIV